MGTIFNDDFRDFIQSLNNHSVEYILVGGYAVILHGYRRVTGDMDIWVNRTKENYFRLVSAFNEFRLPVFDMIEERFLNPESVEDVSNLFFYGNLVTLFYFTPHVNPYYTQFFKGDC